MQNGAMAKIEITDGHLLIRLRVIEKIGTFRRGDLTVPLALINGVWVTANPFAEVFSPNFGDMKKGTPTIAVGTSRHDGQRDFHAVYRNQGAVIVETNGAEFKFTRVIVSSEDPEADATRIRAALAER